MQFVDLARQDVPARPALRRLACVEGGEERHESVCAAEARANETHVVPTRLAHDADRARTALLRVREHERVQQGHARVPASVRRRRTLDKRDQHKLQQTRRIDEVVTNEAQHQHGPHARDMRRVPLPRSTDPRMHNVVKTHTHCACECRHVRREHGGRKVGRLRESVERVHEELRGSLVTSVQRHRRRRVAGQEGIEPRGGTRPGPWAFRRLRHGRIRRHRHIKAPQRMQRSPRHAHGHAATSSGHDVLHAGRRIRLGNRIGHQTLHEIGGHAQRIKDARMHHDRMANRHDARQIVAIQQRTHEAAQHFHLVHARQHRRHDGKAVGTQHRHVMEQRRREELVHDTRLHVRRSEPHVRQARAQLQGVKNVGGRRRCARRRRHKRRSGQLRRRGVRHHYAIRRQ